MKNKFRKVYSENWLLGFLLLTISPFLFLFLFNHPAADDFTVSDHTDLKDIFNAQVHYYQIWGGRYFSNLVLSLNPLYFKSFLGYKLFTLFIMLMFVYFLFSLLTELPKNSLNFKNRILLTLSIIFLYLYAMPSVSQSFYWMISSVIYQTGLILIMMFLKFYMKFLREKNKSSGILLKLILFLLIIAVSGSSEISMVIGIMIISTLAIINVLSNKKFNPLLLLLIFTSIIFSLVMLFAPGNSIRALQYPDNHNFILSLTLTFSTLTEYLISWIFQTPLLYISLLTIPVTCKIKMNSSLKNSSFFFNPGYSILFFLLILFILFFIPVWSIGNVPFSRTVNMIYFVFLAGWFYNVIICLNYFSNKFSFDVKKIPDYLYLASLIIVVLFLFKKNNVKNVYADLLKGRAAGFNRELNERYDFINNSSSDTLVFSGILNKPATIFICDVSSDPKENYNLDYAQFFNKKSLCVTNSDTLIKK